MDTLPIFTLDAKAIFGFFFYVHVLYCSLSVNPPERR